MILGFLALRMALCERPVPLLAGLLAMLALQALINVAVVTGLAPTKGIALPLISRGGTGWILTAFSLGMVAAIARASDARRRSLETAGVAEPELDGAMPQPA